MFLPLKERRKKTEQDVYRAINIFVASVTERSILGLKALIFFLDQTFDGVTCFLPFFDFRAFSAQARIVSTLSHMDVME